MKSTQSKRVEAGLPFVEALARRMASTMPHSIDISDLVQDGAGQDDEVALEALGGDVTRQVRHDVAMAPPQ